MLALEAKWSSPNESALAGLEVLYDDEVMYFGKKSSRDEVVKEKRAFARKFPEREYRPKEPISVLCSDRICTVSGLLDFRSVDPVARIVSEGVASFEYRLIMSQGSVKAEGYRSEAGKINALHLHSFVNWHWLDINRTAMVTLILTPFHVSRGTVP